MDYVSLMQGSTLKDHLLKQDNDNQWFYLANFTALCGNHSQLIQNGPYFPNFMYFSTYFLKFYDIISQL